MLEPSTLSNQSTAFTLRSIMPCSFRQQSFKAMESTWNPHGRDLCQVLQQRKGGWRGRAISCECMCRRGVSTRAVRCTTTIRCCRALGMIKRSSCTGRDAAAGWGVMLLLQGETHRSVTWWGGEPDARQRTAPCTPPPCMVVCTGIGIRFRWDCTWQEYVGGGKVMVRNGFRLVIGS